MARQLYYYRSCNLCHEPSTIKVEGGTGYVLAVHNEIAHSTSDFLGSGCPTQRDSLQDSLFYLLRNCIPHLGRYGSRAKSVGRHVIASQLQGYCLGETENARFSS